MPTKCLFLKFPPILFKIIYIFFFKHKFGLPLQHPSPNKNIDILIYKTNRTAGIYYLKKKISKILKDKIKFLAKYFMSNIYLIINFYYH